MSTRQSPTKWSLSLGLPQVAILIGLVTGCLCAAYYLGFFSGQTSGFEMARASTASNVAKLPVVSASSESNHEEVASEVYAKLNTDKVIAAAQSDSPAQKNAEPDLSVIRKAEVNEELRDVASTGEGRPDDANHKLDADVPELSMEREVSKDKLPEATAIVRELKGSKTKDSTAPATLGDLLQQREADLEKTGAFKQAKPTAAPEVAPIIAASRNPIPEVEHTPETVEKAQATVTAKPTPEKSTAQKVAVKEKEQPKAKPTPTPAPKKNESAKIPRGWFAQVAAPRTKSDAEALTKKLRGAGFSVVTENAEVRGQTYFRLLVGPESSRETTERLVNQLRREKYLSSEPFVRMVK